MMKAKKKLTKLWSILLTLVMVVGMLPTTALATGATPATATATADFFADPGAALALLNAAKTGDTPSAWDYVTNTLTLNGVNFETSAATAVQVPANTTIVLNGENTIKSVNVSSYSYGIWAKGDLIIQGTGTLNVTGGNTTAGGESYGIGANKNVTINGGTITATGGTATNDASYGIYADGVTINGGTVTATGNAAKYYSCGICAKFNVTIKGGTVNATGGTTTHAGALYKSSGIYSGREDGNTTISGGIVKATGGTAASGNSYGIYVNYSSLIISGGSVIAEAGAKALSRAPSALPNPYWGRTANSGGFTKYPNSEYSYGANQYVEIWSWDPTKTIDFTTDDTTKVLEALALLNAAKTGTEDSTWDSDTKTLTLNGVSFATYADIAVKLPENATIELNGDNTIESRCSVDDSSYGSHGIYAGNDLTITGTGKLSVTGGTDPSGNSSSSGIRANGVVAISGGTVKAKGGAATGSGGISYGIYAADGVTISGAAAVTATGGTAVEISYGILSTKHVTISGTAHVTATGGTAVDESYGIHAGNYNVTISGGTVIAEAGSATTARALNKAPNMLLTSYQWRTSNSGGYTNGSFNWDDESTYVEIQETTPTTYIITFDVNGANASVAPASGTTNAAGKLTSLPTPIRSGYTFNGWYTAASGGTEVTSETTFTENTTVYAQWTAVTYSVTWKSQDGNSILETDSGVASGTAPSFNSENPTKAQDDQYTYTFAGWATSKNQESGKVVSSLPKVTGNVTYYAAFSKTERSYSVTLNTNGGTINSGNVTTYTYGTGATLPTPTKTGYTFGGWYASSSFTGDAVTAIASNATGAKTFYAKWNVISTGSSGGGSSSTPTYQVESAVSKDADGSVSFSQNSAKKGDAVTITVTPDRYYKVDGVTVKDASGKEIAVTDNGDGTFTFQMPDSKVTVEPVFSWDNPFVDVAENDYFAPAVEWALKNGITDGTGDGTTFSPSTGCTRAQIVTFLWRAAGCPEPAGANSFTDVFADAYYAKAVAWALENGITTGTGNGTFSPNATCTRAQAMAFIYRSEQARGGGMQGAWMFRNPFSDVNLESYYGEAVMWAVANGVTDGTSDTTFSPNATCTRGQIVTFLYRFFVK